MLQNLERLKRWRSCCWHLSGRHSHLLRARQTVHADGQLHTIFPRFVFPPTSPILPACGAVWSCLLIVGLFTRVVGLLIVRNVSLLCVSPNGKLSAVQTTSQLLLP